VLRSARRGFGVRMARPTRAGTAEMAFDTAAKIEMIARVRD
jgi:hypothetical protein